VITGYLYLFGALGLVVAIIWASIAIYRLGKSKGRQEGINEVQEVNDEAYTNLADDVLHGGHPYRVHRDSIAEISGPGADSRGGVASDS